MMTDSIEKILIGLGAGVISAIIAAFVTKQTSDKSQMLQYIVQERQKWRETLREETQKIIFSNNVGEIKKYRTFMEVRLNPKDDIDLLNKLDEIINAINSSSSHVEIKWTEYSKLVAKVLKDDWERAKHEVTEPKVLKTILYYLIAISIFSFIALSFKAIIYKYFTVDELKSPIAMTLYTLLFCTYAIILINLYKIYSKPVIRKLRDFSQRY